MLLVVLYLISQSGTFVSAIPMVALYAFAGYRLMPAMQQIYISATALRFVRPSVDAMYKDMKGLQSSQVQTSHEILPLKEVLI